ncbi:MAG: NAD(P)/FAD-dependent oxidoreductase, partial [Halioglobus sp.]|nr:NAD(P)/FAD-dependent oxidoreductase [Halioglobus sp.]
MQQVHHSIIVGSGFSGLCMAIRLLQSGIEDFLILEKESALGGTWRDNHYPGAECDVPSALYSYSFERKTDWDYQWSEQSQILEYIAHVADKHGLRRHIRFDSELRSADYDESAHTWQLTLDSGEQLSAQYLVAAVGQLHKPSVPQFAGAESFAGASFHSARWDHSVDLAGKSVAVIGNAASAVQNVPQIADRVGQLTIYQRSP